MTDRTDHQAILAHIAELSRNARANWFGLIGLCLFVGVTLLGHKDADFFAFGAETRLPLVNVEIPVKAFFRFAPLLVAALYIYLHLYLMSLWDALADAPARIDGKPLADAVYPWLISHAALWYRNRKRRGLGGGPEGSSRPRALGWAVVVVSLFLGWAFGLAVLGFLWFRSLPAHDEWLTLWTAACFWCAACVGWSGFRAVRLRMRREPREMAAATREAYRWVAGGFAFALFFMSWEGAEGGLQMLDEDGQPTWLYQAKLAEAVLTRKPSGTLDYEFWVRDYVGEYRKREKGTIPEDADLTGDRRFIEEAVARFNAPLDAPDLQDSDLRQANMARAFLPGADLRRAEIQGANLSEAEMQGADLRRAEMQEAVLTDAELQGANLSEAKMQGADLGRAQMQGTDLSRADIQNANLSRTEMQGADLREAKMQGASVTCIELRLFGFFFCFPVNLQGAELREANMRGADLREAEMKDANLSEAEMQGANLRRAKMQGANLRGAEMQGADLREAEMQNADCSSATLRGTLLQSATVTCRNLTQRQLQLAVGNSDTLLPQGLTVASCLETLPEGVREALAHHPEEGDGFRRSRAEVEDALLCDRDADGNLIEQPLRVGRHPPSEQK